MGDPKKKTKFDSHMYITYEAPAPAYPFYLVSFKFSDKDNSEKWKYKCHRTPAPGSMKVVLLVWLIHILRDWDFISICVYLIKFIS